ncbi:MAG: S-adenosylmethionine:tRNA ribosyltransferase-isomerase [Aggregatilineales bacterium]
MILNAQALLENVTVIPDEALNFILPHELEASEPPEARGLTRDAVRLMVSSRGTGEIEHIQFHDLPNFLRAGDVLAINTSGTLNAALNVQRADGTPLELHLSTRLPGDLTLVETYRPNTNGKGIVPLFALEPGETLTLPDGGSATIYTPYIRDSAVRNVPARLWVASLALPLPWLDYLDTYGFPIRYNYVHERWPLSYYQNVYATEPGSAEMPSAGRAFTPELITQLVARGVQFAPLILHTGVASLEAHEPPYEEYYRVSADTARIVNQARAAERRVIAVGTTVIRTLETVTDSDGQTHPGEGWTALVITPDRHLRAVDGLLTGLHEPRASHLAMLTALAGRDHIRAAYGEALRQRYLWHEFGDLHLILP